ncbi:hypothetical protein QBC39DRAFT_333903 [Podospora conica]|nr:hypothetical protein QBC39DRAFT_333903 [Schizothecium conicum]
MAEVELLAIPIDSILLTLNSYYRDVAKEAGFKVYYRDVAKEAGFKDVAKEAAFKVVTKIVYPEPKPYWIPALRYNRASYRSSTIAALSLPPELADYRNPRYRKGVTIYINPYMFKRAYLISPKKNGFQY